MFCVADVWRLWPVVHLNAASAEKKQLRDLHVVRVLADVLRKAFKGGSIYGNEAKPNKLDPGTEAEIVDADEEEEESIRFHSQP